MNTEPTRLHIVRHGQVALPWRGRIYGCLDVPLSEEGRREARAAAQRLAPLTLQGVVCSGLERTAYGAERIADGRDLAVEALEDLREIDRGRWGGLELAELDPATRAAWLEWHRRPSVLRPPEGESLGDLAGRVLPAIEGLVERYPQARLALVVHSWVARVLVCEALGIHLDQAPKLEVRTGALSIVDWPAKSDPGGRPTLVSFGADRASGASRGWFRGPHRSPTI